MRARLRQIIEDLMAGFWLLPSLVVLGGIAAAELMINFDRWGTAPEFISVWLYGGGETGARTLLGAIAGSTIAVAGTVFSITIATLTLASNQMGPRLLSNFTRDRGNQITLGVFLGTFAYVLVVLRSVRGVDQGAFVPHVAISWAIVSALACVGMLIYFVAHAANRINFDTVIHLVASDLAAMLERQTTTAHLPAPPDPRLWDNAKVLCETRSGYIQQLDDDVLANWAVAHGTVIRLMARIGDFVFPGAPLMLLAPPVEGGESILTTALVIGPHPTPSGDIEFAVDQLVDVAIRALSSGVNDPNTAIRVLNQLGAALCRLSSRRLNNGVVACEGKVRLQRDATSYDGLCDAMFHVIRQSGATAPSVLLHMFDVLTGVALCEHDPLRRQTLRRHALLLREDGRRNTINAMDRQSLERRADRLLHILAEMH